MFDRKLADQERLPTLGFVILAHAAPNHLHRLVESLNALYDSPPIACHFDFSKLGLETARFSNNVRFVQHPVKTGWGKWSLVQATLLAIKLLYQNADPDYFFVISGADYPSAPAQRVYDDLQGKNADAFIDSFLLKQALESSVLLGDKCLEHHRSPENVKLAERRYLKAIVKTPVVRLGKLSNDDRATGWRRRLGRSTRPLFFDAPLSPFDESYKCYVGSQWFTANRQAALKILNPSNKDLQLRRHLRGRIVPDETYFQTVLCNASELAVEDRTFRFSSWRDRDGAGGAHPKDLNTADFDEIVRSKAHFARKFKEGSAVLDMLDEYLGII